MCIVVDLVSGSKLYTVHVNDNTDADANINENTHTMLYALYILVSTVLGSLSALHPPFHLVEAWDRHCLANRS